MRVSQLLRCGAITRAFLQHLTEVYTTSPRQDPFLVDNIPVYEEILRSNTLLHICGVPYFGMIVLSREINIGFLRRGTITFGLTTTVY